MELDDLKQALNRLDQRLESQAALNVFNFRRDNRERVGNKLRPLVRAQIWLIAIGVLVTFVGVDVWHGTRHHLGGLFVCGVITHIYGVLMVGFGAVTMALIGQIEWTGPVIDSQKRLARLRKAQILAGIVLGMPWCFLWVVAIMVAFRALFGVDAFALAPGMWLWQLAGGAALMAATFAFYLWARTTGRAAITRGFENAFTGERLRRVQAELDEIARFERD